MTPMTNETLTALDASFLAAEGPGYPLHIGGVATFDGGRLDDIRTLIAGHLDRVPRFRQKVLPAPFGVRLPQWVDAPQFDVADHVKVVKVEAPGDDDALFRLAAELNRRPLDRSKPLWEMWFVEGLDGGRIGLVEKVHHALVDGVSGAESLAVLLDPDPDAPMPEPAAWEPSLPPAPLIHLVASLATAVTQPAVRAAGGLTQARRAGGVTTAAAGWTQVLRPDRFAPRCSLNAPAGDHRVYVPVRQDLEVVKRTGKTFGAKVNDIVLAAVTSGLRTLLAGRDELDRLDYLQALVPVSLRTEHERLDLGNKVSGYLARLPVGEQDPLERLETLRSSMNALKESTEADLTGAAIGSADLFPLPVLAAVSDVVVHRQPFVNVVVTNVPGPQLPLYMLGSEMLEAFPYVPITRNLTVGIAILSYNGQLNVAITADPDAAPDVGVLADGIRGGFGELADLAGV
jgi:diacylglycerol O-acyltransferase / wax synthase